jgi:hypothetical protein
MMTTLELFEASIDNQDEDALHADEILCRLAAVAEKCPESERPALRALLDAAAWSRGLGLRQGSDGRAFLVQLPEFTGI